MKTGILAMTALAGMMLASSASAATLLTNGGFENLGGASAQGWGGYTFGSGYSAPLPGWSLDSGSVDVTVTGQDDQRRVTASARCGRPPAPQTAGHLLETASRSPRWKGRQDRPLEDCVGEIIRTVKLPIEAGKVREYAIAMKGDAAIYHDRAAALAQGYANIPAPPTFTSTASFHVDPELASFPVILEMNRARMVHGEQHWSFLRAPVAGEVLTGVSRLVSVKSKLNSAGRTLRFVEITTDFADQQANLIVQETMLSIEKVD